MPKKETSARATLRAEISAVNLKTLYVFHGEERYLLEKALEELREKLLPQGIYGFNYRRHEGAELSLNALREAVETLPFFAERTLIEVFDCNVFRREEETTTLLEIFSSLPEHVCLVLIYDTVPFKLDKRTKAATAFQKLANIVEFEQQEQPKLAAWVRRHFAECGKMCDAATAEYLSFITGGLMTPLLREIEKLTDYVANDVITRADVDAIVTPVIDAVAYKMTDAIANRDFDGAAAVLSDLLAMREPAHKLIYQLTLKARQLLSARLCFEKSLGSREIMSICGIRHDFQARGLLAAARNVSTAYCRRAVLLCCETALALNSGGDEEEITRLLIRLASIEAAA
jgi:DNA polymerase-3 subunit delta